MPSKPLKYTFQYKIGSAWHQHPKWYETYTQARSAAHEHAIKTVQKVQVIDNHFHVYCE